MDTTKTPDPATLPLPETERYTYADYTQLPEGAPYELIHGELVVSPSPSTLHQRILRRLARTLDAFIEQEGRGEILFAPMDVRFSEEDTVQPDLIAEILSPSTAYRDLTTKKRLYEQHGVREYWIVDPEGRTVEVFELTGERFMQHTRAVETGTTASTLLDGFQVDLTDLFQRANA